MATVTPEMLSTALKPLLDGYFNSIEAMVSDKLMPLSRLMDQLQAKMSEFSLQLESPDVFRPTPTSPGMIMNDTNFPQLNGLGPNWNKVKRGLKAKTVPSKASFEHQSRFGALNALKEFSTLEEKSKNVVIVGLPELADDAATNSADENLCQEVFRNANLDATNCQVQRHGKKVPGRHQIVKILTDSKDIRDRVLKAFRQFRPSALPKTAYVRRDMTPTELEHDRLCKQECYELNKKEGKRRFIVRDLNVIELKKEHWEDFRAGNPTPTSIRPVLTSNRSRKRGSQGDVLEEPMDSGGKRNISTADR